MLLDGLQALLSRKPGTLMIVGQNTIYLKGWLSQITTDAKVIQTPELHQSPDRPQYCTMLKKFQGALVLINEGELGLCRDLVERLFPLLADDGFLMLAVVNGRANAMHDGFAADFAFWSSQFLSVQGCISTARTVLVTPARVAVLRWLLRLNKAVLDHPFLTPLLAALVGLLTLVSYAVNRLTKETRSGSERSRGYSSVFMVFQPSGWSRLPAFAEDDTDYWARKQAVRPKTKYKLLAARDV